MGERKFDVTKLTKYPMFDTMIRQRGWEELNNMVHELNNKYVIMEFFTNAPFSRVKYQAYVRGRTVDFSPAAINGLLGLTPSEECEVQRLRGEGGGMEDEQWDELIAKMCRPGATWKMAQMLTYADFLPIPKAWASFVIQTLESTSCNSEIPLKRVFTVAAILDEKPIDVGTLIPNNIHELVTEKRAVVGHGSIINWLCEKKLVEEYDGDLYMSTVQPIIDTTMDGFVKKYEAFLKEREGGEQQLMHHDNSSRPKWSMEREASMVLTRLSTL